MTRRQLIGRHSVVAEVLRQHPGAAEVFQRHGFVQPGEADEQLMPAGDATVEASAVLYSADLDQLLTDLNDIAEDQAPISLQSVMNTLKTCFDSEIPLDIVDLGLVYDVRAEGHKVQVDVTQLTRDEELWRHTLALVEAKLKNVPGVDVAEVRLVWEPAWAPDRLSDYARQRLGLEYPPRLADSW